MNVLQASFMLTPLVSTAIFEHSFLKDGLLIFLITHPLKDHSVAVRLRTSVLNVGSLQLNFSFLRLWMYHIRHIEIATYKTLLDPSHTFGITLEPELHSLLPLKF
jgi:hypothetical protein